MKFWNHICYVRAFNDLDLGAGLKWGKEEGQRKHGRKTYPLLSSTFSLLPHNQQNFIKKGEQGCSQVFKGLFLGVLVRSHLSVWSLHWGRHGFSWILKYLFCGFSSPGFFQTRISFPKIVGGEEEEGVESIKLFKISLLVWTRKGLSLPVQLVL